MAHFGADFINVHGADNFEWYSNGADLLRGVERHKGEDVAIILYDTEYVDAPAAIEIKPVNFFYKNFGHYWTHEDRLNVVELVSRLEWDSENQYWLYKEV